MSKTTFQTVKKWLEVYTAFMLSKTYAVTSDRTVSTKKLIIAFLKAMNKNKLYSQLLGILFYSFIYQSTVRFFLIHVNMFFYVL